MDVRNIFSGRKPMAALVIALSVALGAGATVLVMAATSPTLVQGGLSMAKAYYSNNIAVGLSPQGVVFDGTNLWTANFSSNTVSKVNPTTGAVVGTYAVGARPTGIVFDGTSIWVTNTDSNSITKLNPATGGTIGTYAVGSKPWGITYSGLNIWVANSAGNTVSRVLPATGAVVQTINVGTGPRGIASDGREVWVTNYGSGNVTRISATTGTVVGLVAVGTSPSAIMYDGTAMWVANSGSGTVTKLAAAMGTTTSATVLGTYNVGGSPVGLVFDQSGFSASSGGSIDPRNYVWVIRYECSAARLDAINGTMVANHPTGCGTAGAFDGSNVWIGGASVLTAYASR